MYLYNVSMDDSFRKCGRGGWSRVGMVRAVDEDEEVMRGLVEQCLVGHLYMQSAPTFTSLI